MIVHFNMMNIDGHGVGVGGGAPPYDEQKLPDTRREKIQGGVHPRVRSTRGKKFFDPPVRPFFWIFGQNHPLVY